MANHVNVCHMHAYGVHYWWNICRGVKLELQLTNLRGFNAPESIFAVVCESSQYEVSACSQLVSDLQQQ